VAGATGEEGSYSCQVEEMLMVIGATGETDGSSARTRRES